ncbi:MAG TPA: trehalose-phosphatase [Thermoanaerobaculia bacterium]|nr:trehalose-phosphatase [Thermoanaerobaculia bacterium]
MNQPLALERWPEIASRLAGKRPALFLDYDGTLSPIVQRPELALLAPAVQAVLRRLAERMPVAILSGRLREDAAALVGLPQLYYAGSHGFDVAGPPPAPGEPPLRQEHGEGVPATMQRIAERLRRDLAGIDGVLVEDKRFAVAVHYRLVADHDLPRVEAAVDRAAGDSGGSGGSGDPDIPGPRLRKTGGKKVWELRPAIDWNKGRALLWLLGRFGLDLPDALPIFLGDDVTDEDAFAAVADRGGIGILVAEEPRPTAAAYRLRDPAEVELLLTRLADLAEAAAAAEWPFPSAPSTGTVRVPPRPLPDDAPLAAEWQPGQVHLLGPLAVPGHAPRLVRVYLPSTFTPDAPRFALYMFDGQNVFDDHPSFAGGWHLHLAVEKLARGKRPAPVVVAIDHGGSKRIDELSPFAMSATGGDGGAAGLDGLLDWLADSLTPRLAAELPLIGGPVGAVIGGSSMGGLAALYAHFRKPRCFGGALVMSPSFWVEDGEILRWVKAQPAPELSRIYLDCGVREGKGILLPQVAAMAAHLATRGYDPDHLMFRADPRGAHSEASWRRRLPRALRFFYRDPTR